jgi:anti-sigma regulatory factor (Ser/Thr protein kinase)
VTVQTEVLLPPVPQSARRARRHVTALLEALGLPALADTAALLVSEVVTNVLLHARSEASLRVCARPGALRVEVCDSSALPVQRRLRAAEAATGRGLVLLDALAERWGTETRRGGKVVWFELALDAATSRRVHASGLLPCEPA